LGKGWPTDSPIKQIHIMQNYSYDPVNPIFQSKITRTNQEIHFHIYLRITHPKPSDFPAIYIILFGNDAPTA
jgi:hypothetical protein